MKAPIPLDLPTVLRTFEVIPELATAGRDQIISYMYPYQYSVRITLYGDLTGSPGNALTGCTEGKGRLRM